MTSRLFAVLALIAWLIAIAVPASAQQARAAGPDSLSFNLDEIILDTTGMGSAAIGAIGTFDGTIEWHVSPDPTGTNWAPTNCRAPNSTTDVESATTTGVWVCPVAGPRRLRVRMTPFVSGSATVTISASASGGGGGSAAGGGGGGGDGVILDGANPAIEATVRDLTNSNPLVVQIVDANGDAIVDFGGGGGGSGDGALQDGANAAIEATVLDLTNSNPLTIRGVSSDGTAVDLFTSTAPGTASTGIPVGVAGCYTHTADPTYVDAQINPLSCTPTGYMRVLLGSGSTIDIATIASIADITGTISLPTGAATAALQPGFGPGGTPNANHTTIQGSSTQTPVKSVITDAAGVVQSLALDAVHSEAVVTGGPQMMFGALAFGANPTAVTAGEAVRAPANRAGVPFSLGGHPNIVTREATITDANGAQAGALISTDISAGTKIITTYGKVTCSNANTVNVGYRLAYSTSTTLPTASVNGVGGVVDSQAGIPPGGGSSAGATSGISGIGGDGEDLRFSIDDPVGGECRIVVKYFTIES